MKKLFLALALVSSQVFAGPFGIDKGMTLEEVQKQGNFTANNRKFSYTANTIQQGHPDLDRYTLMLTPSTGVCQIIASTNIFESDAYGSSAMQKFQGLVDALARKYGAPSSRFDFLRTGSIWSDPRDWMTALLKKERNLEAFWTGKKLPDSLESIGVKTVALSRTEVAVMITYQFDNVVDCANAAQATNNANL